MAAARETELARFGNGAAEQKALLAWVEYLRDMGISDLYQRDDPGHVLAPEVRERLLAAVALRTKRGSEKPQGASGVVGTRGPGQRAAAPTSPSPTPRPLPAAVAQPPELARGVPARLSGGDNAVDRDPIPVAESARTYFEAEAETIPVLPPELLAPMPRPNSLEALWPLPAQPIPVADRSAALEALRAEIGDCTRCPLAYAGRHTIVFGEGNPGARLLFVGEGPGADEDATGRPFVGKAGQLLTNMIAAMGLAREDVFISNIVKCRPPGNRVPEFAEATTCSQFLLRQIDIVRPEVIVALGSTAATYVLGVRQSLASLRGQWFRSRGAKVVVTYHPAFLLRDPRQKPEAWKDLQAVMAELGLQAPGRKG